jgi:hypothetical protein
MHARSVVRMHDRAPTVGASDWWTHRCGLLGGGHRGGGRDVGLRVVDTLAAVTIYWNEIEILRAVDGQARGEGPQFSSGYELARVLAAARGEQVEEQDLHGFVAELFVLSNAQLLTWQVTMVPSHVRQIDPREPLHWLQNVRELALTVAGRDRARGQVIRVPLEDPGEDDGRTIRTSTLEQVAEIIWQNSARKDDVQQLLVEGGVSSENAEATKGRVLTRALPQLLIELADGTSGRRRELRGFLGLWLDDGLFNGPSDEQHAELIHDLARQGWFVHDSRLVIGERVRRSGGTPSPPGGSPGELHRIVWGAASAQWSSEHWHEALFAAAKAIDSMLQTKLERRDISGVQLVQEAFSANAPSEHKPRLRFPAIEDEQTRQSVTQGALSFGVGCFQAIRNPVGHLPNEQHELTRQEAFERLAALSLLTRWIEDASVER